MVLDDMILSNFDLPIFLYLNKGVESGATVTINDAGHVRSRTSQPGKLYITFKVC